jgi:hypothetical protein
MREPAEHAEELVYFVLIKPYEIRVPVLSPRADCGLAINDDPGSFKSGEFFAFSCKLNVIATIPPQ